eukprot:TRINITY_DN26534_c0_g1_i1.p1 TRINITY_DN26534_c0_g1~~TRINITY_DN26534_c0_g1_i1.p1  ORF type:complete len:1386 (+),score=301.60 TRINITY_DN26534_c0_g1_i1:96-4160(+)
MAPWQQTVQSNREQTALVAAEKAAPSLAGTTHALAVENEPVTGPKNVEYQADGPGGVTAPPKRKQANVVEMLDYVKGLGIDPVKEADMLWIADEAFNASLPPGWNEHEDDQGRVYFHNSAMGESSWRHPMDGLFEEIVGYYREVVQTGGFWGVEDKIANIEENIRRGLAEWMELYDEYHEKFFYNRRTDESRFDDPRMAVYHGLYTRIKMIAKMKERLPLLAQASKPPEPTAQEVQLQQYREEEEARYLQRLIKIQSMVRAVIARRIANEKRKQKIVQKGKQPLRGKLRLRIEGHGTSKELVLSQTTPARRDKAAVKVQARIKGILARKRFRPLVLHRAYLSKIITVVQARARVWLAKRRVARKKVQRRVKAATDVERVYRGYRDRQYVSALKAEKKRFDWMLKCVLTLQCGFRMCLAYKKVLRKKRQLHMLFAVAVKRQIHVHSARNLLTKLRLLEEPIQFVFTCTEDPQARIIAPWSFQCCAAPWVGEDSTEPYFNKKRRFAYADLFSKEGAESYHDLAARRIQAVGRGMLSRNRVRHLRKMTSEIVNFVLTDAWNTITTRRRAANRTIKVWRGRAVRQMDLLANLYAEYLRQRAEQVGTIQAYLKRYQAQEWLEYKMDKGVKDKNATRIQSQFRGMLARRHADRLREEALWPVKGWFEYVATARNEVQIQTRFLCNPSFDAYKYFLEHGVSEDLGNNLDHMDKNVEVCTSHLGAIESIVGKVKDADVEEASFAAATEPTVPRPGEKRPPSRAKAKPAPAAPKRQATPEVPKAGSRTGQPKAKPKAKAGSSKPQQSTGGKQRPASPEEEASESEDSEFVVEDDAGQEGEEVEEEDDADDETNQSGEDGSMSKRKKKKRIELTKDRPPLVEPQGISMAQTVLREAPRKYKDKAGDAAVPGKDAPPSPGSAARGATQGPNAQKASATSGPEAAPQADKTAQVAKRKTYGGTLEKGKFVKNAVDLDKMTEAEKKAILSDIEEEKRRTMVEVAEKQEKHKLRAKMELEKKKEKYNAAVGDVKYEEDQRRHLKEKEMKNWLKQKEEESRAKKAKAKEMLVSVMEKENQKSETLKKLEEQRLRERERRLRAAQKQKAKLEDQLLASKVAAGIACATNSSSLAFVGKTQQSGPQQWAGGMPVPVKQAPVGMEKMSTNATSPSIEMMKLQKSPPPGVGLTPAQQRVLHRHIHHHVHYHDGEDGDGTGADDRPMDVNGDLHDARTRIMSPQEQRRLEMSSEARIRDQIEAAPGTPAERFGIGGVDNFAETPHMQRGGGSMQRLLPGGGSLANGDMTRTQEAFRRTPSLPQIGPFGGGRAGNLQGYSRSIERAFGSYADSGRPRYVQRGYVMAGGGLGAPPA